MSFQKNTVVYSLLSSLPSNDRLLSQLLFIKEIDSLKNVWRHTMLIDRSRKENDAEHSWEMAMMALILKEYFSSAVDTDKVIRMLLVHDLVEIYAGDTYVYDQEATPTQSERERQAANTLFGLLPADQSQEFRSLWEEFEARQTNESCMARALDRFQPLLHSYLTEGETWKMNSVDAHSVRKIMHVIGEASPALGKLSDSIIEESINRGYLRN